MKYAHINLAHARFYKQPQLSTLVASEITIDRQR